MPIQIYFCELCYYDFEIATIAGSDPPQHHLCPYCGEKASWRPPTGTNFIIKDGGTGAQKGSR